MHNQNCLNINHKIGLLVDTIISFHACDPKVVKLYFLTLLADCVQIVYRRCPDGCSLDFATHNTHVMFITVTVLLLFRSAHMQCTHAVHTFSAHMQSTYAQWQIS